MRKIIFLLTLMMSLAQYKNANAMENEQENKTNNVNLPSLLLCSETLEGSPFNPNQGHQSPGKTKIENPVTRSTKAKARLFEPDNEVNAIFPVEKFNDELQHKKRKRLYTFAEKIERNEQTVHQILKDLAENAEYETAISVLATIENKKRNDKFINEIKKFIGGSDTKNGTAGNKIKQVLNKEEYKDLDVNKIILHVCNSKTQTASNESLLNIAVHLKAKNLFQYLVQERDADISPSTIVLAEQNPGNHILRILYEKGLTSVAPAHPNSATKKWSSNKSRKRTESIPLFTLVDRR